MNKPRRALKLPPAPSTQSEWPWVDADFGGTFEFPHPRITIVTPSYNQGQYLEQTIRSVLLQGYPKLEYIIIDGNSMDHSKSIIQKYEEHLAYWISEPDRGQTHAINKGFEHATGDILAWLNSDDFYLPGTLWYVARQFAVSRGVQWITGNIRYVDSEARYLHSGIIEQDVTGSKAIFRQRKFRGQRIFQPATFWTQEYWEKSGPLDEKLFFCMDQMLWYEGIVKGFEPLRVDRELAAFRMHADSKTMSQKANFEFEKASIHFSVAWDKEYNFLPNVQLALKFWRSGSLKKTDAYLARNEPLRASIWLILAMLLSPRQARKRLYTWRTIGKLIFHK